MTKTLKTLILHVRHSSRPYRAESLSGYHSLQGPLEWFTLVPPVIKSTSEQPPLECMQNAGDLMYIPANWKHQTLNLGEAIGVGGQAVYSPEARLRDGIQLLKSLPGDPDLLHTIGVGLAHRGIEMIRKGMPI
ncbi:unnamed protein product, partial [Discosporangium mesarthrocarpum]